MEILPSPDGRYELFCEGDNLAARDREVLGRVLLLTLDGEPHNGFGTRPDAASTARREPDTGQAAPPVAVWSPDGRRVAVHRLDDRRVDDLHLVEHLAGPGRRTAVRAYRHPLAGAGEVPVGELWIIEVEGGQRIRVDLPPQELLWLTPIELGRVWWSQDSARLYVLVSERGERALELYEVHPDSGAVRRMVREEGPTYVEANLDIAGAPNVRVLSDTGEVIWFSERTGWAHLELRDGDGGLLRQLTGGQWVVRDIVHLDPAARQVWFTASGREPGRDPYYRHLYRVGLDGTEPALLTSEDADHEIGLESAGDSWVIVDEYARVGSPTVCVTRDPWTGAVLEKHYEHPAPPTTAEPFEVVSRDGTTPLYGLLFRPTDFDPARRYPVIDHIYGFPQTIVTPKRSAGGPWQALADLGYVVVLLDGMGTAYRSKAFHDLSFENLQDATLPDHISALHQLAQRRPWMDLDRIGVFGSSGGGTATVRALCEYPDLFKVGVAIAGDYDHRDSIAYILEKYQGPDPLTWPATGLTTLADRLQGRLLLVWGELDDNVHPLSSMRLLDAFIRAGKDVDILVVPGADHFVARHWYVQRKLALHFIKHL